MRGSTCLGRCFIVLSLSFVEYEIILSNVLLHGIVDNDYQYHLKRWVYFAETKKFNMDYIRIYCIARTECMWSVRNIKQYNGDRKHNRSCGHGNINQLNFCV
jgi:hypothetical protein